MRSTAATLILLAAALAAGCKTTRTELHLTYTPTPDTTISAKILTTP